MNDRLKFLGRNWLPWFNLALIVLFVLVLAAVIVIYSILTWPAPAPPPTSTETMQPSYTSTISPTITLSPTVTRTSRPTFSPTITQTPLPTSTVTLTPSPPGPPTLTPAKPLSFSDAYNLVDWSPEEADRMVRLMADYPNTLPERARGEEDAAYYEAFQYAVFALEESLYRFPEASQAEDWRWMYAYNLARTGDPKAGQVYGDIITRALSRGDTDLSNLYIWFQEKEPHINLFMVEFDPPSGFIGSYLVEVRGHGSAFIWLLETPGSYQSHVLVSGFDFVNASKANWIMADLNGDSGDGPEVAIYFSNLPGDFTLHPPHVFNLSQLPAKELPFFPEKDSFFVGMEFTNQWAVVKSTPGYNDLAFLSNVFPACPVTVTRIYRWNGEYFAYTDDRYQLASTPLSLAYCQFVIDHAIINWGPEAAISLMEPLTPEWPPETDLQGEPYPLDAKDEWRFRLGIYHALLGEYQQAESYMRGVIDTPSLPLSRYILRAKDFLAAYQEAEDIYKACVLDVLCNPAYALEYLVDNRPAGVDTMQYLWQHGVQNSASGYFDFDGDDLGERWFTIRHRLFEEIQFWILADYLGGVDALRVTNVESNPPQLEYLEPEFVSEEALVWQPVTFLDKKIAFHMQRLPDSKQAYLVDIPLRAEYPNRYLEGLQAAYAALFSGVRPSIVKQDLVTLAEWPGLLCEATWSCDPYYYLLGLASELANDERTAAEAYHTLWLNYSKSPFTTMARLKLAGSPVYFTPTPTSTMTTTATVAPTTTLSPTPTITGTPPTATPTPTLTPTISGTPPTPTATATVTPTVSGTPQQATLTPTNTIQVATATNTTYPPP